MLNIVDNLLPLPILIFGHLHSGKMPFLCNLILREREMVKLRKETKDPLSHQTDCLKRFNVLSPSLYYAIVFQKTHFHVRFQLSDLATKTSNFK